MNCVFHRLAGFSNFIVSLCATSNLRRVARQFAVARLLLGVTVIIAVMVPASILRAADGKDNDAASAKMTGTDAGDQRREPQPKTESARALFARWQASARLNGEIPGGVVERLAEVTGNFLHHNPTSRHTPKLAELFKRMDVSHDWTTADVVQLLDDVSDVYHLPKWALEERFEVSRSIQAGEPLPVELKTAPWGNPHPNGLRAAWLLDPISTKQRLNTPLKSRILIHNSSDSVNGIGLPRTIVFKAANWQQSGGHTVKERNQKRIKVESTYWTTIPQIVAYRLAPGEYVELAGANIGIGERKDIEDWRHTRVGFWIAAQAGDEVTFTPAPVQVNGRGKVDPDWWQKYVRSRLKREMPFPDDAAERTHSLKRSVQDLFGTPATPQMIAAFVNDTSPDVLDNLVNGLVTQPDVESFNGQLQSGPTTFEVLPIDPDSLKKPRLATGPGRYQLNATTRLLITARSTRGNRVTTAQLEFTDDSGDARQFEVKLPDAGSDFAIGWKRDSANSMWVVTKGILHHYDFSDPTAVQQKRIATSDTIYLPEPFRDSLSSALKGPVAAP